MVWPTLGSRTAKEQEQETALVCDGRSFSDINVSQGSVATRCGGIFDKYFAANLLEKVTVKKV